ncbi:muscle M-line assembly protein unc-89-like [Patiria miniata]|uniref:Uncharacterized protein n=1 Tax=Patiria miniata TaxID=46514 RepID=A0A913ZCK5_PATMI|nr:muscle M-line assembly protein unc-89-like [Patiria miniata]
MANDAVPFESLGVIGVWTPSTTEDNTEIKLPRIGRSASNDSEMVSSSRTLPARDRSELSASRLSPRPGRKLRLSVEQADRSRHRSVSPHSPRDPRPITRQSLTGQDASLAGSCMRDFSGKSPPRDILKSRQCFIRESEPSIIEPNSGGKLPSPRLRKSSKLSSPVFAKKTVSPRSVKKNRLGNQTGVIESELSTSLNSNFTKGCRPPRLSRAKQSSSTESEDEKDSPRGLSPLPPISVSPRDANFLTNNESKTSIKHVEFVEVDARQPPGKPDSSSEEKQQQSPIRQRSSTHQVVKSRSLDSEPVVPNQSKQTQQTRPTPREKTPNWLLEDHPSLQFSDQASAHIDCNNVEEFFTDRIFDRIPLPDRSNIFQQALDDMKSSPTRPSSHGSDPGDLHIRRSSLVTNFLDLAALRDSLQSPKTENDSQLDVMSVVPEGETYKEPHLTASAAQKVSNWAERSRKVSTPTRFLSVDQKPATRSASPKRRVVSEIQPPRMEFLEPKTDKPRSKTISDSKSDSALISPSIRRKDGAWSTHSDISEISRPLLSKRAMCYVMKFIESASSIATSHRATAQSSNHMSRDNSVFPSIPNRSARRSRDRRDSIRIVQQLINERSPSGDTTEIASFDDLRNCRYLRNIRTGDGRKEAFRTIKKTTYHEW